MISIFDKIININPEILSGTPVFYGTRVPIKNLFDYLETGETIENFLDDFPSVNKEQILSLIKISEKLLLKTYEVLYENIT